MIRPSSTSSGDPLRLTLSIRGIYPAELTPAWVPRTIPALLPAARRDPLGLVVTGVDGSDRVGPVRRPGRPHSVHARPLGAGGPRRDLPRRPDHPRRPRGGVARRRPGARRRRRAPRCASGESPSPAYAASRRSGRRTRTRSPPGVSPWVRGRTGRDPHRAARPAGARRHRMARTCPGPRDPATERRRVAHDPTVGGLGPAAGHPARHHRRRRRRAGRRSAGDARRRRSSPSGRRHRSSTRRPRGPRSSASPPPAW